MPTARPFTLREMTLDDLEGGLRLCRASHWNQVQRDWEQFLRCAPREVTVAVDDADRVVGTAAVMRYAALTPGSLAWVAMVLVDPACRGRGLGTALLHRGLSQAAGDAAAGLDATPLGRPLYEKLGFVAAGDLMRMLRSPRVAVAGANPAGVRPAVPSDLEPMAALDARATGLDRRVMLEWLLLGARALAWVSEGDGPHGLDGFMLGRYGHAAVQLGPVCATCREVAVRLVSAGVASEPDCAVLLDVAVDRPGWGGAVEELGFTPQRPFTRMYRGPWRPAGEASHLFASIGPEFG